MKSFSSLIILSLVFFYTNINAQDLDYPFSISYTEGSILKTTDNTFTLLDGSIWLKNSYDYLLPTSKIFIVILDSKGTGIAYSNRADFNTQKISGTVSLKKGSINMVTNSLKDGAILQMYDNSFWEISSYDQFDTSFWLPPYEVIITSNELYLINFKKGKKIWATRVD